VSRVLERLVHGLRVVVDRDQCVGFGDCVKEAPEGFKLDEDSIVVFVAPEAVERERLLRACAPLIRDCRNEVENALCSRNSGEELVLRPCPGG